MSPPTTLPRERYQAYVLGWHMGSGGRPSGHIEYKRAVLSAEYRTGYQDGQRARAEAAATAAERVGLK